MKHPVFDNVWYMYKNGVDFLKFIRVYRVSIYNKDATLSFLKQEFLVSAILSLFFWLPWCIVRLAAFKKHLSDDSFNLLLSSQCKISSWSHRADGIELPLAKPLYIKHPLKPLVRISTSISRARKVLSTLQPSYIKLAKMERLNWAKSVIIAICTRGRLRNMTNLTFQPAFAAIR